MAHRFTEVDVERSLQHYRDVTGDHDATLLREATARPEIYRVLNTRFLQGYIGYGAFSAANGIDWFCAGYEAGRRSVKEGAKTGG